MNSPDFIGAVASLFFPGLGQLIHGRMDVAARYGITALLCWYGPEFVIRFYLAVGGQTDLLTYSETYASLSPFIWLSRVSVHCLAAYEAATWATKRRRRRRAPLHRPGRRLTPTQRHR